MLRIMANAKPPATDCGYLLDKNLSPVQSPELWLGATLLKWKRTRKRVPLPNPCRGDQVEPLAPPDGLAWSGLRLDAMDRES